ncbi:MAG: hypothetical protein Q8936_25020, partial [Bacillota bacterium]|nr:hypothetical protein [Bacillota bacterium]
MAKVKKFAIIFSSIILLGFSLGQLLFSTDLYDNLIDNVVWSKEKKVLNESNVSQIIFYSDKSIELKNEEKDVFVNKLKRSKFYRNNEQGQVDGGVAIGVVFKDGSKESFEYCGASVFQMEYKGRVFSIKNEELEQILLEHDV